MENLLQEGIASQAHMQVHMRISIVIAETKKAFLIMKFSFRSIYLSNRLNECYHTIPIVSIGSLRGENIDMGDQVWNACVHVCISDAAHIAEEGWFAGMVCALNQTAGPEIRLRCQSGHYCSRKYTNPNPFSTGAWVGFAAFEISQHDRCHQLYVCVPMRCGKRKPTFHKCIQSNSLRIFALVCG